MLLKYCPQINWPTSALDVENHGAMEGNGQQWKGSQDQDGELEWKKRGKGGGSSKKGANITTYFNHWSGSFNPLIINNINDNKSSMINDQWSIINQSSMIIIPVSIWSFCMVLFLVFFIIYITTPRTIIHDHEIMRLAHFITYSVYHAWSIDFIKVLIKSIKPYLLLL